MAGPSPESEPTTERSAKPPAVAAVELPDLQALVPPAAQPAPVLKTPLPQDPAAPEEDLWDDPTTTGGVYKSDTIIRGHGEPTPVPASDRQHRTPTALIRVNPDIGLQDPNYKPEVEEPGKRASRRYEYISPDRRDEGPVTDGREALARMDERERRRVQEISSTRQRISAAEEQERREALARARERQQREIEEYQRKQRELEQALAKVLTTVERAMRDAADVFLALSICPDHVEFLRGAGDGQDPWKYVTWQGRVYTYEELLELKDDYGALRYLPEQRSDTVPPVFYSARERRWQLDQALSPKAEVIVVERALPVVRRHPDGSPRYSAKQASTVLMEEGLVTAYVSGPRVYLWSHLAAAHRLHERNAKLTHRITASLGMVPKQVAEVTGAAGEAAGRVARSVSESPVMDTAGAVIDSITAGVGKVEDAIRSTTRFFRRKP